MIYNLMLVAGIYKVFLKYPLSYAAFNAFKFEILNHYEERNWTTERRDFICQISNNYKCFIITESIIEKSVTWPRK